jgi:outer membrane murein-binding lipoprotein Lpp
MRPGHAFGRSVVVLAIGASLLLSGCSRTSQSDIDKAKAAGASEEAARQKQASVEADIQKLKKDLAEAKSQAATPSSAATSAAQTPVPRAQAAQGASCGGNLSVGANTSCSFAFNVAAALSDAGGGSRTLSVYSPVTGRYYTMTCVAGIPTVCRGGNNAVVYIR